MVRIHPELKIEQLLGNAQNFLENETQLDSSEHSAISTTKPVNLPNDEPYSRMLGWTDKLKTFNVSVFSQRYFLDSPKFLWKIWKRRKSLDTHRARKARFPSFVGFYASRFVFRFNPATGGFTGRKNLSLLLLYDVKFRLRLEFIVQHFILNQVIAIIRSLLFATDLRAKFDECGITDLNRAKTPLQTLKTVAAVSITIKLTRILSQ